MPKRRNICPLPLAVAVSIVFLQSRNPDSMDRHPAPFFAQKAKKMPDNPLRYQTSLSFSHYSTKKHICQVDFSIFEGFF
jgi:hypothetical protein